MQLKPKVHRGKQADCAKCKQQTIGIEAAFRLISKK